MTLVSTLIACSSCIVFLLGLVHLVLTFHGLKLTPRDPNLKIRLTEVAPVISRQTTMWRAWIGFNASHSFGAIFFGAVYGYLSTYHIAWLAHSPFLQLLGLSLLVGYVVLAKLYWFSVPRVGLALAAGLYAAAMALNWLQPGMGG